MIQIYQANISRNIRDSELEKYLAAGWSQSSQTQAEEQIVLKPPARVKAAVKEADDDAIISKGE
jgi:hypothetical protein